MRGRERHRASRARLTFRAGACAKLERSDSGSRSRASEAVVSKDSAESREESRRAGRRLPMRRLSGCTNRQRRGSESPPEALAGARPTKSCRCRLGQWSSGISLDKLLTRKESRPDSGRPAAGSRQKGHRALRTPAVPSRASCMRAFKGQPPFRTIRVGSAVPRLNGAARRRKLTSRPHPRLLPAHGLPPSSSPHVAATS